MCLGGLFVPEAYITATRQYVAQANSWSLEELCLEVNVTNAQGAVLDACSFGIKGQRTRAYRVYGKLYIITIILINIEISIIQTIIFEIEKVMHLFSVSLPKNAL